MNAVFTTPVTAEGALFSHVSAGNEAAHDTSFDSVRMAYLSALGDGRLTISTSERNSGNDDKPFDAAFHKAFAITQVNYTGTAGLNGTYGNDNRVSVTGSATGNNSARIIFGSSGTETSSNNKIFGSQTGTENTLTATVTGSTNMVKLTQTGSNTSAAITVTGSTNRLNLTQAGSHTSAAITVSGDGNTAAVTQTNAAASASTNLNIQGTNATIGVTQQTPNASNTYTGTIPSGGSISITQ